MVDVRALLEQREREHQELQAERDAAMDDYRRRLSALNDAMKPLRDQLEAERLAVLEAEANQPIITFDAKGT